MWNESGGPPDDSEAILRAEIAELQNRRISVADAYLWTFNEVRLILRHPRFVLVTIAILATDIAVTILAGSPLLGVVGVLVLAWAGLYSQFHIEEWVEEYNAEIDAQIRLLLAGPDNEG